MATSLRFPANRLRIVQAVEATASEVWLDETGSVGNKRYTDARVGLELEAGRTAGQGPTQDDQFILDTLILLLRADAAGTPPGLSNSLSLPYLLQRAYLCSVRADGRPYERCQNATAGAADVLFAGTPPPMLPPYVDPFPPPAPTPPPSPMPPPPEPSYMLFWLVPLIILAVIILIVFFVVNAFCIRRLLRNPDDSRILPSPSPQDQKVRVGGGGGYEDDDEEAQEETDDPSQSPSQSPRKERRDVTPKKQRRRRPGTQGATAEQEEEESSSQEGDDGVVAGRPPPVRAGRRSPYKEGSPGTRPGVGGSPGLGTSPRGRGWQAQCRANISYEPPNALLSGARLVSGPLGKPTYTLPPIAPGSPMTRRMVGGGVTRGRTFTDEPPPENRVKPPELGAHHAIGPAPWIAQLSPLKSQMKKGAPRDLMAMYGAAGAGGMVQVIGPDGQPMMLPPGAQQLAGAPPGATPSARMRNRGNVRQRLGVDGEELPMEAASAPGFADPAMMHEQMMAMQQQILAMQQAAQQGGGVEGMGPVVLPGMEMQGYPAQEGMAAAPGCSGPSTGGRPTVSFAPKMKEMEVVNPKKEKEKKKTEAAKKAKEAADKAKKQPVAELALAETVKKRVHERREQRAKATPA